MKRWRRRLIWAGVFAIVMLGGLAGWFYYAVVLHFDFALHHAEAFAFRRMTVSTLVDVTPVNRTRNFHNFSLETPEFSDDLFLRLTNEETARSRQIHRVLTEDGRVHWVPTRGR